MTTLTIFFSSNYYSYLDLTTPYIYKRKKETDLISDLREPDPVRFFSAMPPTSFYIPGIPNIPDIDTESFIMEGPGSGYFLDDEIYTKNSGIFQWNETTLSQEWEDNISLTLDIIKLNRNSKSIKCPADQATFEKEHISLNWVTAKYENSLTVDFRDPHLLLKTPTKINLVGWSRGAISCHMLANAMLQDNELKNIPINILALDPVIDPRHAKDHQTKLGSNVKEYVGLYARDERSSEIPCVIPDTDTGTKIHIYPIAGRHTTLVGHAETDGANGPGKFSEPHDLAFSLALRCLYRWASPEVASLIVRNSKHTNMSYYGTQTLEKIKNDYNSYVVMRNTTYSGSSKDIKGEREIYLNGEYTNFTAAQGSRFTPSMGLAKGHILDMSYFSDIT